MSQACSNHHSASDELNLNNWSSGLMAVYSVTVEVYHREKPHIALQCVQGFVLGSSSFLISVNLSKGPVTLLIIFSFLREPRTLVRQMWWILNWRTRERTDTICIKLHRKYAEGQDCRLEGRLERQRRHKGVYCWITSLFHVCTYKAWMIWICGKYHL